MRLVKAWSGKWHIFEEELAPKPAIPIRVATCDGQVQVYPNPGRIIPPHVRTYPCPLTQPKTVAWGAEPRCHICAAGGSVVLHPLPQPERRVALTVCGEEVMVRSELEGTTTELVAALWSADRGPSKLCSKCPIRRRLALDERRV